MVDDELKNEIKNLNKEQLSYLAGFIQGLLTEE